MSEMVERLAKVIAESLADTPREIAVAVLLAMQEPTEEMSYEGSIMGGPECSMSDAQSIWDAMVDAALKEKERGPEAPPKSFVD